VAELTDPWDEALRAWAKHDGIDRERLTVSSVGDSPNLAAYAGLFPGELLKVGDERGSDGTAYRGSDGTAYLVIGGLQRAVLCDGQAVWPKSIHKLLELERFAPVRFHIPAPDPAPAPFYVPDYDRSGLGDRDRELRISMLALSYAACVAESISPEAAGRIRAIDVVFHDESPAVEAADPELLRRLVEEVETAIKRDVERIGLATTTNATPQAVAAVQGIAADINAAIAKVFAATKGVDIECWPQLDSITWRTSARGVR